MVLLQTEKQTKLPNIHLGGNVLQMYVLADQ